MDRYCRIIGVSTVQGTGYRIHDTGYTREVEASIAELCYGYGLEVGVGCTETVCGSGAELVTMYTGGSAKKRGPIFTIAEKGEVRMVRDCLFRCECAETGRRLVLLRREAKYFFLACLLQGRARDKTC